MSQPDILPFPAPLSVIETWPKPNYVNPVTEGPGLQIVGIFLTAIATLLVTARIYSRIFITRALGLDDYLVVVSLVRIPSCAASLPTLLNQHQLTSIAMTVLIIIGNKEWDSGRHIWDVPVSNFVGNRKNVWETEWQDEHANLSRPAHLLICKQDLHRCYLQRQDISFAILSTSLCKFQQGFPDRSVGRNCIQLRIPRRFPPQHRPRMLADPSVLATI